jgi:hypothetical protein
MGRRNRSEPWAGTSTLQTSALLLCCSAFAFRCRESGWGRAKRVAKQQRSKGAEKMKKSETCNARKDKMNAETRSARRIHAEEGCGGGGGSTNYELWRFPDIM